MRTTTYTVRESETMTQDVKLQRLLKDDTFRRSANNTKINQMLLKMVAEQEKIVKQAAQILNIPEEVIAKAISNMKPSLTLNLDGSADMDYNATLRRILEVIVKLGDAQDIIEEYNKTQKKGYQTIQV